MGLAAAGLAWTTGLNLTSGCAAHVMPPPIVLGLVLGLVMAPAMSPATSGVAAEDAGVASATVNTMQQIGGSIGTALMLRPTEQLGGAKHQGRGRPTASAVRGPCGSPGAVTSGVSAADHFVR